MKSMVRLFLVLVTLVVILFAWITGQLGNPRIQLLTAVMVGISLVVFILLNVAEQREARKRRKERESRPQVEVTPGKEPPKRSDTGFSLKEKKSGLTWGGGNIRASEATRGTRRKFLGK